MRTRSKAVLQVCLAFACALSAGLSGDMYANHGQQSHHANRHTRSSHARGNRSVSRTGQNDQSADLEALHHHEDQRSTATASGSSDSVAIFTSAIFVSPVFVKLADAVPFAASVARPSHSVAPLGRAPPAAL